MMSACLQATQKAIQLATEASRVQAKFQDGPYAPQTAALQQLKEFAAQLHEAAYSSFTIKPARGQYEIRLLFQIPGNVKFLLPIVQAWWIARRDPGDIRRMTLDATVEFICPDVRLASVLSLRVTARSEYHRLNVEPIFVD